MSAKHTPGPWEIRSDVPYSDGRVVFHGRWEANVTVCRLWHFDKDTQEANARLIAAAPELLEALKKVEEALKKDSRGKTITGDSVEYHLDGQEMYHAINLARAAIARAEGGQS